MKFLHLADLHIGKNILEQSLIEDQKYILEEIVKKIKEEKIEAVLIAGDVYDRSVPSSEAVNLLDSFLNTLIKELKVKVFMIAGNHDSKERLNFGSKIFENDGLYICANYEGTLKKVQLEDEFGKIKIYMLPYIKPVEVKKYFEEDEEINSFNDAIKKILEKEDVNPDERNIILSHQFVTAGASEPERSDSETLYLGGTENVDVSNYDKFDYVALGHIHGPQRIGRDTARYAGTMLKYSFSEVNHNKSLAVIDFKEELKYELIPLTPLRDMRVIKGPIEELIKEENYKGTNVEDYIKAIITNEEPVYDAIGQIRRVYPNVLRLEFENSRMALNIENQLSNIENINQKSEIELFEEFFKFQNNQELNEMQKEIMNEIIKDVKKED